MPRDQVGELAIHRRVGDVEDVTGQRDRVECRAAKLRQPLDERRGGIERRAGKRTKAGDENSQSFAHQSISAISSAATEGEIRPLATSDSIRLTLARTDASARSLAMVNCSSIDHIHFTCCCCRRAANSPEAFMAVR